MWMMMMTKLVCVYICMLLFSVYMLLVIVCGVGEMKKFSVVQKVDLCKTQS